jgi:galactokinase/mevalonate kinase-like predicted kinase
MNYDQPITCSAPGRAGIIGNPTDMYGGSVLSCSVGMRARVTITPADRLTFATNQQECHIATWDDLRPRKDLFDLPRAILDYMRLPTLACRVEYESDIPLRSGLAGSTALVVAILKGLLACQGKFPNTYQLAEMARYIELHHLKVVCGYQDAYMCTFGGLNYMDFRGKQFYREAEAELLATIEPLGGYVRRLPFVLGYTGVQHSSGAVHRPIRERWLEGEPEVVAGYERMTEIARTSKKALLLEDWTTLGELMNENHAIQRDFGGSGESNERLIAAALGAGALGAKLAGAGDGGTIIALWPEDDSSALEDALRQAGASATYRLCVAPGAIVENPPEQTTSDDGWGRLGLESEADTTQHAKAR